LGYHG
jgi:hypothetical protein